MSLIKTLPDSKSKITHGTNAVMPHQNILALDVTVRNGRLTLLKQFKISLRLVSFCINLYIKTEGKKIPAWRSRLILVRPQLRPKTKKNSTYFFFPRLFFTFEGFKSSIFDKNGLEKLKRGICTRHNRVTKL